MNPLANPDSLIRRVYAYVAYRIGNGPDAEDVTSEVFERALRYRSSYDQSKGAPIAWLIGIARSSINEFLAQRRPVPVGDSVETEAPGDLQEDAVRRLTVAAAVARLDERARELVALRYGADLTARQIGELVGAETNAIEVALHRTLARLRTELREERPTREPRPAGLAVRIEPTPAVLGPTAPTQATEKGRETR